MMRAECKWRSGVLAAVMAVSLALAGCGGGGSGAISSSEGVAPAASAGPSTFEISLNAVSETGSSAAPVTVAGSSAAPTADPAFPGSEHATNPKPEIAHVYMDIVKISLMPAEEVSEGEDMDGQIGDSDSPELRDGEHGDGEDGEGEDGDGEDGEPHFVTLIPDSPIRIDLLKLENGKKLARFLNRFDQVPAGTYDKIRIYYRNVKVVLADGSTLRFLPTANSKFDIRFREGHELVIPATTDLTQPDGWVKFFRVKLDVVGLNLRIKAGGKHWKGSKVILRPQIFAEFVPPILYSVAGTAANVSGFASPTVSGTFDVVFGTGPGYPRTIHAAFNNNTAWAWSDDVLSASFWVVDVANTAGFGAFRDRATVEAIGRFDAAMVFRARDIVFTFPDVRSGGVEDGWKANDTFALRLPADKMVIPEPGRHTAYYDNVVPPNAPLTQAAIDNNVFVKARGYFTPGGIEAFWISVAGKVAILQ